MFFVPIVLSIPECHVSKVICTFFFIAAMLHIVNVPLFIEFIPSRWTFRLFLVSCYSEQCCDERPLYSCVCICAKKKSSRMDLLAQRICAFSPVIAAVQLPGLPALPLAASWDWA